MNFSSLLFGYEQKKSHLCRAGIPSHTQPVAAKASPLCTQLVSAVPERSFNEISHLMAEFPDTGSLLLGPRRFKNKQRNFSTHTEQSVSHGWVGSRLGFGRFGR